MKKINVLSAFNGMGCIWIALDRLGIQVDKRYSSEIDKYANIVNDKNYPDTIQLGDVTKVKAADLEQIDLLVGGSPCQSFSSFGNGTGLEGKSGLFWEYARILKEASPKYFLLENVNMKKEWQDIISKELGVQPVAFNSNLVSAQNRDRLYWTNIPFTLPKGKGIKYCDVLEDAPFRELKPFMFNKWGDKMRIDKGVNWVMNDKANCLTTKNCHTNQYLLNEDKTMMRLMSAIEFERLQTVPEGYTDCVSNTERYKMIGNGWTVDVIAHILSGMQL